MKTENIDVFGSLGGHKQDIGIGFMRDTTGIYASVSTEFGNGGDYVPVKKLRRIWWQLGNLIEEQEVKEGLV